MSGNPEQLVACGMSAGIVDVLELIEVHEAQCAAPSFCGAGCNLGIELRNEPVSAVKTCKRIVIRDVQEVLFAFLQCEQRVVERLDDCLSFLVSCSRKCYVRRTLGNLRERLLQLRQWPQSAF